jgi:tetratricopeptide (TPR) repeat protein
MRIKPTLIALATAVLLASCATLDDTPPATTITPMPGLGTATFAVTAKDEQARAWFAQGLQLTYAFEHTEAVRVFRAALARDPSCAMCAWGVAYALGPNINNPDRGPVRDIRGYIQRAQQAAAGASPLERALIQAMAVRYGRAPEREQRLFEAQGAALCSAGKPKSADQKTDRKVDPQDLGYAAAMADVLRQFPNDPDVVALYADAVMTTMAWEWWDPKTGKPNGAVADVLARLATATQQHPQHTGTLHFYVHLAEHSPNPRQAELAADTLGTVAPGSPHLVHMGSHIYKNIGRFDAGSLANQQALDVQKQFDAILQAQGAGGRGNWDAHHLHFLWFAALMEGRVDLSVATAREYARRYGNRSDGAGEYAALLPLATLVRLGQWQAVLAEPPHTGRLGIAQGYTAYARGMAHAHSGQLAQAKAELATLQQQRALPTVQRATIYGDPIPSKMLTVAQHLLAGRIARTEGRPEQAIAGLREAADLDDEFGNDPPLTGGGARLALAGALLDAGQLDEAGKQIAESQRLGGPSAWVHQGLSALATKRGARDEAQRQAELARTAWRNAQGASLPVF